MALLKYLNKTRAETLEIEQEPEDIGVTTKSEDSTSCGLVRRKLLLDDMQVNTAWHLLYDTFKEKCLSARERKIAY